MTTELEIWNLAFTRLGLAPVASTTEQSASAKACRTVYPRVLDSLLRIHEWNFARHLVSLSLDSASSFPGWTYSYVYPPACLYLRKVVSSAGNSATAGERFAVFMDPTSKEKRIATNLESAYGLYTVAAYNTEAYDSLFVDALAWRLALDLTPSLRGDLKLQTSLFQNFRYAMEAAMARDAQEEDLGYPSDTSGQNPYLEARS